MAIREDLVSSAVTFLQDPSVAASPLDKRIAFLQSKNLSQEEVDAALARAGDPTAPPQAAQVYSNQQVARPQYGYPPQQAYWGPPPQPEVPRRDWRDYFIMATVMSGLGYGMYFIAKRYIVPLIAPPTPPQIEQDKSAIDEAFNRAFGLIEQLAADTQGIKESEEARKERLDSALAGFEQTIQELKDASRRRDDETRRVGDEVRSLQGMIPKAMKAQEHNADQRLKDLGVEMASLKRLITNRIGGSSAVSSGAAASKPAHVNGTSSAGTQDGAIAPANGVQGSAAAAEIAAPKPASPSPLDRFSSGKGGIPAWQLAASKKEQEAKASPATDTTTSSTGAS